jgi:hypothetical protein
MPKMRHAVAKFPFLKTHWVIREFNMRYELSTSYTYLEDFYEIDKWHTNVSCSWECAARCGPGVFRNFYLRRNFSELDAESRKMWGPDLGQVNTIPIGFHLTVSAALAASMHGKICVSHF